MHRASLLLFLIVSSMTAIADEQIIEGMIVSGIEQSVDDEEAPFDILARNKIHNCGGKPSNRFRVHSEYETVAMRRFLMAMKAMEKGWRLNVKRDGCEGNAMVIHNLGIQP